MPGYTYRVVVASVPVAAELITPMYTTWVDRENRIKKLKEDRRLGIFSLQSFEATNATFRTDYILDNLLMGFLEMALLSCWFERQRADWVWSFWSRPISFSMPDGYACSSQCPEKFSNFSSAYAPLPRSYPLQRSWTVTYVQPMTDEPAIVRPQPLHAYDPASTPDV